MSSKTGSIKVNTQDIFPIIKKWLYSEHDIFLRELISNASDAISKRKILSGLDNKQIPEGKIEVTLSKENKTITISDNGLGMTEEEIEKYITRRTTYCSKCTFKHDYSTCFTTQLACIHQTIIRVCNLAT